MKDYKLFQKYYNRLVHEAMLKSVLCGLIIGFAATLVTAFCFWMIGFKFFWLAAVPLVAATAAATPVFYFRVFKPTTKVVASRIDELGLEERMITMNQLKNEDTYIAKRQREDALKSLSLVSADLLKIVVSVPMIVAVAVLAVSGIGMTTVSALASNNVIKSGQEMFNDPEKDKVYYEVNYEIRELIPSLFGYMVGGGGDGEFIGDMTQIVEEGEDATEITFIAPDGYMFVQWDDGNPSPTRQDTEITEDTTRVAYIVEMTEGDGEGDGDGEGEGEGEGEGDSEKPGQEGDGEGEKPGDGQGGGQGGSWDGDNGKIIDGNTDYGDYADQAAQDAMESTRGNANIDGKGKDAIGGYFDGLK